ncbi:MAG: peptide chain release factor family protein [Armatimonadota bacterium]
MDTPYWALNDEELLKQCDWYAGRASGPGGQKRNKTHSAIRMTHRPTGISAIANEHRLQGENRALALKRLRHALALAQRAEIDLETFTIPVEVQEQLGRKGKLAVNPDNPRYLAIISLLLDLLVTYRGQVSRAADRLGISTTNFINLLHHDPKLWTAAQELRKRYGHAPLKG